MAVADFLRAFASFTEADRLASLHGLDPDELEIIQAAFEDGHLELSWPCEVLLVSRLYPPDPPAPTPLVSTNILLPREMAEIRAARFKAKEGLYSDWDDIRGETRPEHLERELSRGRNGSPLYEAIKAIEERQAEEVEDWRDELMADLAAMRALTRGNNGNSAGSSKSLGNGNRPLSAPGNGVDRNGTSQIKE